MSLNIPGVANFDSVQRSSGAGETSCDQPTGTLFENVDDRFAYLVVSAYNNYCQILNGTSQQAMNFRDYTRIMYRLLFNMNHNPVSKDSTTDYRHGLSTLIMDDDHLSKIIDMYNDPLNNKSN